MPDLIALSSSVQFTQEKEFEEGAGILAQMHEIFEVHGVSIDTWGISKKPLLHYSYKKQTLQVKAICNAFAGCEMIMIKLLSCWLSPSKIVPISSFLMHEFKIKNTKRSFYFNTCSLFIPNTNWAQAKMMLGLVINELEIGLISFYHAKRILDLKALSFDHKNFMLQEALVKRLQKFNQLYDYDVFSLIQRVFLTYSPTFCSFRTNKHLLETVLSLYHCRLQCKKQALYREQKSVQSRSVHVRVNTSLVQGPLGYADHLTITASFSLLNAKEIFEKDHFLRAVSQCVKSPVYVEDSFFLHRDHQEKIAIFAMEVTSQDCAIKKLNRSLLQDKLQLHLPNFIQTLESPIFMPLNEEEVMKNIVQLSSEIKCTTDIPQMILNFENQDQDKLYYRAILVRVSQKTSPTMASLFFGSRKKIKAIAQREKTVPFGKDTWQKEIGVFRVELCSSNYLRQDLSVDVFKAREAVCAFFRSCLGEIRDFNGALLSFELSAFNAFSKAIGKKEFVQKDVLEKFYYAIYPAQKRLVVETSVLQALFLLYIRAFKTPLKNALQRYQDNRYDKIFIVLTCKALKKTSLLLHQLKEKKNSALIAFYLDSSEVLYIGAVFQESQPGDVEQFSLDVQNKILLDTRI